MMDKIYSVARNTRSVPSYIKKGKKLKNMMKYNNSITSPDRIHEKN